MASIRAWRLEPEPETRTTISRACRSGADPVSGGLVTVRDDIRTVSAPRRPVRKPGGGARVHAAPAADPATLGGPCAPCRDLPAARGAQRQPAAAVDRH